jgi:WhiB family transcriptional regulator, redox-sensing transcriptional regulator
MEGQEHSRLRTVLIYDPKAMRDVPADLVDETMNALADALVSWKRPAWHAQAACRGEGVRDFFADTGRRVERARALCGSCPVRAVCAEAGRTEEFGVWGAMLPRERRTARRAAS